MRGLPPGFWPIFGQCVRHPAALIFGCLTLTFAILDAPYALKAMPFTILPSALIGGIILLCAEWVVPRRMTSAPANSGHVGIWIPLQAGFAIFAFARGVLIPSMVNPFVAGDWRDAAVSIPSHVTHAVVDSLVLPLSIWSVALAISGAQWRLGDIWHAMRPYFAAAFLICVMLRLVAGAPMHFDWPETPKLLGLGPGGWIWALVSAIVAVVNTALLVSLYRVLGPQPDADQLRAVFE